MLGTVKRAINRGELETGRPAAEVRGHWIVSKTDDRDQKDASFVFGKVIVC